MQTIQTVSEMKAASALWRSAGKQVALVPTMGALHAGQLALIRAAKERAEIVVVAAFVNPQQFESSEIVSRYPRDPVGDADRAQEAGATVLFNPDAADFYSRGFSTRVAEGSVSATLCGVSRPTHFCGVTTLMVRLFNIVRPQLVFFGQKTAQRAAVVQKMISDLDFDIEVAVVPTVREEDGLAAGTYNAEFTPAARNEVLSMHRAFAKVGQMFADGVRSPDRLIAEATHIIGEHRRVHVVYVSIVDRETMQPVRDLLPGQAMMAISIWLDDWRLIDNLLL